VDKFNKIWSLDRSARSVADLPTKRPGRLRSSTQSSRRPPVAACHCRRSLFCCCSPTTLEQSACRRPVCPITQNTASETENIYFGNHAQTLFCSCVAI